MELKASSENVLGTVCLGYEELDYSFFRIMLNPEERERRAVNRATDQITRLAERIILEHIKQAVLPSAHLFTAAELLPES